jgi:hypothetical protein
LISKWIFGIITDKVKNSYGFKLIFRGSLYGFTNKKFHEICDNQSHTITIIKVKGSDEILGGYNPIAWKSEGGYIEAKNSFIFSFKDGVENYTLGRIAHEELEYGALFYASNYGPSFGDDLCISGDGGHCTERFYDKQIKYDDFSIEEYEVFQIIDL